MESPELMESSLAPAAPAVASSPQLGGPRAFMDDPRMMREVVGGDGISRLVTTFEHGEGDAE